MASLHGWFITNLLPLVVPLPHCWQRCLLICAFLLIGWYVSAVLLIAREVCWHRWTEEWGSKVEPELLTYIERDMGVSPSDLYYLKWMLGFKGIMNVNHLKTALERGDFESELSDLGFSDLNLLHKAWQASKVHREVVAYLEDVSLNTMKVKTWLGCKGYTDMFGLRKALDEQGADPSDDILQRLRAARPVLEQDLLSHLEHHKLNQAVIKEWLARWGVTNLNRFWVAISNAGVLSSSKLQSETNFPWGWYNMLRRTVDMGTVQVETQNELICRRRAAPQEPHGSAGGSRGGLSGRGKRAATSALSSWTPAAVVEVTKKCGEGADAARRFAEAAKTMQASGVGGATLKRMLDEYDEAEPVKRRKVALCTPVEDGGIGLKALDVEVLKTQVQELAHVEA